MDNKIFTTDSTGQIVQITTALGPDWAFIPAPLPASLEFDASLWPRLISATENLARLDGIGRTLPNPGLLLTPLQMKEALRSSRLEGTYTTPEGLLSFDINPRKPKSVSDPVNDQLEVHNYNAAMVMGQATIDEGYPISLRLIRDLHRRLMTGVRGKDKQPGEFRQCQVQVGARNVYMPPPANYLDHCLNDLEQWINTEETGLHPLVKAYMVHYQFEAIHPFNDGNGRVGRLLLALMIYKSIPLNKPWLYMSSYFEKHKEEYVNSLFKVSTSGNWWEWIDLCLIGTEEQAKDAVIRCDLLVKLKQEHYEKTPTGAPRLPHIIDALFDRPFINIPTLMKKYSISYPTAKSDIEKLIACGVLCDLVGQKPKNFYSPGIITTTYADIEELIPTSVPIFPADAISDTGNTQ